MAGSLWLDDAVIAAPEPDCLRFKVRISFASSPEMVDPLSEVIALLRPRTVFSKGISGAGRWAVRYSEFGQPSFCAVLEGRCRLAVDGRGAGHARGRRLRAAAGDAGLHDVELRAGDARRYRSEGDAGADRGGPPRHAATARPTCACSAAISSSTRPTRRCWCRCCRRWCTCAASSGCRCWCGWSARRRRAARRAASSCSRGWSRCC